MTVGELRKKLEKYQDDTEIFVVHNDEMLSTTNYCDPYVSQETVRTFKTKKGYVYYVDKWTRQENSKQTEVLVIS